MSFDYLSDNLIELRGPVNITTDLAINEGAVVSAKLYDTLVDTRLGAYETVLTEDSAFQADSVIVRDAAPLSTGTIILLELDDGSTLRTTIINLSGTDNTTVQLLSLLDAPSSTGNKFSVEIWDSTSTIISIDNFQGWESNMNMEISLDDTTLIERTISLVNPDSGYLSLSGSPGFDVSSGNIVKRKIGADITMSNFGTFPNVDPVAGDPEWGFRGIINHDHSDIQLGMRLRGEITLVDGSLNLTRKALATVINQ